MRRVKNIIPISQVVEVEQAQPRPVRKSVRFEIFARDGFTCQYCGRRPPDVILELDHIHPQAHGGSNDAINLITACVDCNRGKRDKILSNISNRPDADLKFLEAQQEIAEARRYLDSKRIRDEAVLSVVDALGGVWIDNIGEESLPKPLQFKIWLGQYEPEEIEIAIAIAAPKFLALYFGALDRWETTQNLIRYISGILRKRVKDRLEAGG